MDSSVITIYGSGTCPKCLMVKKFLTDKNVQFAYKDISDAKVKDAFLAAGYASIPVTFKNGHSVIGFDPIALQELIDID